MGLKKYCIATIGSHTALQILKGAKDEGFKTLVVCKKESSELYRMFNVADEFLFISDYREFPKIEEALIRKNAIIIPHASFIAYMGQEAVEKLKVPYFGNKKILKHESDRVL